MKALQRQRREQLIGADVLSGEWRGIEGDIGSAEVRPISYAEARALIKRYEDMPPGLPYCFGIFFERGLGGAVAYGSEYGENLDLWDRYGYSGKIIALLRGASAHWAHPHTGSKLIRRSMRLLLPQYKIVTATVDPRLGEVGTVYQACGFDYVGQMYKGIRLHVYDGDREIFERETRRRYGTGSASRLRAFGLKVEYVPRRERYFAFRGTPDEQETLRAAIADKIKPYPKRPADETAATNSAGRIETKGYVRVRSRLLQGGGSSASFDLLRAGKFIMTFGSQRNDQVNAGFWPGVNERMLEHGLDPAIRARLIAEMRRKGAR